MAEASPGNGEGRVEYEACCKELADLLEAEEFTPLFTVEDDGTLLMSVGCAEVENEGLAWLDHVVNYCPLCGTCLQGADDTDDKDA